MRPRTRLSDLPSTHDVVTYIHNKFAERLNELKADILVSEVLNSRQPKGLTKKAKMAPGKISTTADCWTADNTKGSFIGMTAHWIEVKEEKWKLRSEVVGFQGVSGDHSGRNLGRYFIGLCDRVGICSKNGTKVRFD